MKKKRSFFLNGESNPGPSVCKKTLLTRRHGALTINDKSKPIFEAFESKTRGILGEEIVPRYDDIWDPPDFSYLKS